MTYDFYIVGVAELEHDHREYAYGIAWTSNSVCHWEYCFDTDSLRISEGLVEIKSFVPSLKAVLDDEMELIESGFYNPEHKEEFEYRVIEASILFAHFLDDLKGRKH